MMVIAERDWHFVDNGEVKSYTCKFDALNSSRIHMVRKIILSPNGVVTIEKDTDESLFFIVLTGSVKIVVDDQKLSVESRSMMFLSANIDQAILENIDEMDSEILVFSIEKSVLMMEMYQTDKVATNVSLYMNTQMIQNFETITYERRDPKRPLYIYLLFGEADVEGQRLAYNDSIILKNTDSIINIDLIKKSELLITELPVWQKDNQ